MKRLSKLLLATAFLFSAAAIAADSTSITERDIIAMRAGWLTKKTVRSEQIAEFANRCVGTAEMNGGPLTGITGVELGMTDDGSPVVMGFCVYSKCRNGKFTATRNESCSH